MSSDLGIRRIGWALASIALGLVPFVLVILFALLSLESDRADLVVYWSILVCGALAVVAALVARAKAEPRALRWIGFILGSIEVVGFVVCLVALILAFRTLG
jgi:hypothetical protein